MMSSIGVHGVEIKKYSCDSSNTLEKAFNKFKKDNPKTRILQVMPYFDGVSESVAILYIANIY
ncbi:hypothetical protein FDB28_17345 [Clostridium botulinum]|jgi:hypothetical protein|uniref:hypothetical protein n=1 Tax=Clostridium sp. VAP51 TaxID=2949978 RepID=UPI00097FDFE9|nr:hypothetical protein [Clostridium sp. VAP51]NFN82020.1 hypothetical protein [Clostridium botulinum]SJT57489.1 Uncharacterised protein [Clostridioides difficile]NFN95778.1 hypothetical protein [Clostridium botulinum]NFO58671.1 hypothetical protein [Clostridium botulinum]NFS98087.1 hypothetical protein [Clostridium botulinum]